MKRRNWLREDIVICHCSELKYRHVHCPCEDCENSAVSTAKEKSHWQTNETLRSVKWTWKNILIDGPKPYLTQRKLIRFFTIKFSRCLNLCNASPLKQLHPTPLTNVNYSFVMKNYRFSIKNSFCARTKVFVSKTIVFLP